MISKKSSLRQNYDLTSQTTSRQKVHCHVKICISQRLVIVCILKVRHDVMMSKTSSWYQKYVMTPKTSSWRQKHRHDVKKYVMTSEESSWRQRHCHDVKNGMKSKASHDVTNTSWRQKHLYDFKKYVWKKSYFVQSAHCNHWRSLSMPAQMPITSVV